MARRPLAIVSVLLLASCGSNHQSTDEDIGAVTRDGPGVMCLPAASHLRVVGDWDDVYAAAIVGTTNADCAIVRVNESTDTEWTAEIKSVRDERGLLKACREPVGAGGKPSDAIIFACTLGIFGNMDAESFVLNETARRLRDLHGVEFAPVR